MGRATADNGQQTASDLRMIEDRWGDHRGGEAKSGSGVRGEALMVVVGDGYSHVGAAMGR